MVAPFGRQYRRRSIADIDVSDWVSFETKKLRFFSKTAKALACVSGVGVGSLIVDSRGGGEMGRVEYDPQVHPVLIRDCARDGVGIDDTASRIGVGRSTLYAWKERYPEVAEALKDGRRLADAKVRQALFRNACGFQYEDSKEVLDGDQIVRVEKSVKHVQPSTMAQIFWLKNRCPDDWREKRETDSKQLPLLILDGDNSGWEDI
jgi:transposase-like protein